MNRLYTDAHLHLTNLASDAAQAVRESGDIMLCSSVFTLKEWQELCAIESRLKSDEDTSADIRILKSFGIHPQNPDVEMLEILEKLLSGSSECVPDAIGEAGYDFFTKVYEAQEKQQDDVWYGQLELAEKYGKPLVVHLRHAVDRMFRDAARLKKLPSVIFHSFPGSPLEAEALRKRGINAYYSFGKPVLNRRRNSIECVMKLPEDWLLFETDAPFQTLKDEASTMPADIVRVYKAASWIRSMADGSGVEYGEAADAAVERLATVAAANFRKAFLLD